MKQKDIEAEAEDGDQNQKQKTERETESQRYRQSQSCRHTDINAVTEELVLGARAPLELACVKNNNKLRKKFLNSINLLSPASTCTLV